MEICQFLPAKGKKKGDKFHCPNCSEVYLWNGSAWMRIR